MQQLSVEWTEAAIRDLVDICDYIEQFSPRAAQNLRDAIWRGVESLLPLMPNIGRRGRITNTRELLVHPNYLVVYRPSTTTIRVIRIIHVKRKFPTQDTSDGFPQRGPGK